MPNYPKNVFINGDIVPYQNAKISVFDRGFLFGDGVYEVMVQIGDSFFYGKEHLERLEKSLEKIRLNFDMASLPKSIERLLEASDLKHKNCLLYIQITRGVAMRTHAFPKNVPPTLVMYAIPYNLSEMGNKMVPAILVPDNRWHRCDIKATSLLGNVLPNDEAAQKEVYESVFVRDGHLTEATHCNVFFVKNGVVFTHPADHHILNGITRQVVVHLCKELQIELREEAILEKELPSMDEAFLTGTTTQILPLSSLDEHQFFKTGQIGSTTQKLQLAFDKLKEQKSNKSYGTTTN